MNESDIQFFDEHEAPQARPAPAAATGISLLANPFTSSGAASAMVSIESSRAIADMQMARFMAKKFPRDRKLAMDAILIGCTSPDLAEVATFNYARGGTEITRPSIRLAEAVAQQWGNLRTSVEEIGREGMYSTVRTFAIDLETGFNDQKTFQVKHWRDTKKGGYQLTDERDIYELVANMGARRKRACIEAVIPREVFNLAVAQCDVTLNATCSTDKDAIETMLTRFERFGILQQHIEAKIQRHLDAITPAQMVYLRKIYNGLKDGMGKPSSYFDVPDPDAEAGKAGSTLGDLVARAGGQDAPVAAAVVQAEQGVTFDSVRAAITAAQDHDALDAAELMIVALPIEATRAAAGELVAIKRDAMRGGAE